MRHFKRTYKQALKRQISIGQYDSKRPQVVPVKQDQRYRACKSIPQPETNAVTIYMMDVSGSMRDGQKDIVRTEAFWIDIWLQSQYDGIEKCYIIHDAKAREVDQDAFYRTRESGGTVISSAYDLCQKVVEDRFPPNDWNIYCFHFSDGDNWGEDNNQCSTILKEGLLSQVNLFGYGQVHSPYGTGKFINSMKEIAEDHENVEVSNIRGRGDIMESIQVFLGKGN
jgi:hypothetical protein